MRYRAVRCCAVLCRAVLCCAFSFVHTRHHTRVPGIRYQVCTYMESQKTDTQLSSTVRCHALPCGAVPCRAVPCCAVPCCALSIVHITRSMCVHECGVRVVFLEHGALGILQVACLHLKCWTIYHICHSVPFFIVSERSGWDRPLREAPCTPYSKYRTP